MVLENPEQPDQRQIADVGSCSTEVLEELLDRVVGVFSGSSISNSRRRPRGRWDRQPRRPGRTHVPTKQGQGRPVEPLDRADVGTQFVAALSRLLGLIPERGREKLRQSFVIEKHQPGQDRRGSRHRSDA